MKTLLKSAVLVSAIAASSFASAATINVSISDLAWTNPTTINFAATKANAAAAELAFLGTLNGPTVTEGFESIAVVNANPAGTNQNTKWVSADSSFSTNVGTFTLTQAGQGSSSWTNGSNAANNYLMIENAATGEYGRQAIDNNGHWLDSNDAKQVVWTLGAPLTNKFNAFGFYLSDASDISGKLTLKFADSNTVDFDLAEIVKIANPVDSNGTIRYVTVTSSETIFGGSLTFDESVGYDGWGIDDVTVGKVPEPGSLMLMGLGLLGLGAARRRLKA